MAYTKNLLMKLLESHLGAKQVASLGVPRAVDELSTLMFLNSMSYSQTEIDIVKAALTDLRLHGGLAVSR